VVVGVEVVVGVGVVVVVVVSTGGGVVVSVVVVGVVAVDVSDKVVYGVPTGPVAVGWPPPLSPCPLPWP
jgi:hypothetical protein